MTIYILNESDESINLDWKIILMKNNGESESYVLDGEGEEFHTKDDAKSSWGGDIISRYELIDEEYDYLNNGSLVIKVMMRLPVDSYAYRITPKTIVRDQLKIFLDEDTSDFSFNVKGEEIVAHKGTVKAGADDLYVMCGASTKENPFQIKDVDPEVFKMMLSTLYGGCIFPEKWKTHSESILKAAGKYGFTALRSEAEEWYAKALKLTVDNAIDEFLKADGNSWTLVREVAKKFILEQGKEIVASDSFVRLNESLPLMREVMAAALDNSKKRKRDNENENE